MIFALWWYTWSTVGCKLLLYQLEFFLTVVLSHGFGATFHLSVPVGSSKLWLNGPLCRPVCRAWTYMQCCTQGPDGEDKDCPTSVGVAVVFWGVTADGEAQVCWSHVNILCSWEAPAHVMCPMHNIVDRWIKQLHFCPFLITWLYPWYLHWPSDVFLNKSDYHPYITHFHGNFTNFPWVLLFWYLV